MDMEAIDDSVGRNSILANRIIAGNTMISLASKIGLDLISVKK